MYHTSSNKNLGFNQKTCWWGSNTQIAPVITTLQLHTTFISLIKLKNLVVDVTELDYHAGLLSHIRSVWLAVAYGMQVPHNGSSSKQRSVSIHLKWSRKCLVCNNSLSHQWFFVAHSVFTQSTAKGQLFQRTWGKCWREQKRKVISRLKIKVHIGMNGNPVDLQMNTQ